MKLKILGCSGGIGGTARTTSMLLDGTVLIDAGTGVGDLSLSELKLIDDVFVTHSHLDHVACIPFMVDSVGFARNAPLTVHATAETLAALKEHIFNWKIWPDFSEIPNAQEPLLRYREIRPHEPVSIVGGAITAIPVNHAVPAVGYRIDSGNASLVFSGDTTTNDTLWEAVNRIPNLRYLIVETAFANSEQEIAVLSRHYCPSLLAQDLLKLRQNPEIYISHLKPGETDLIMQEIGKCVRNFSPGMLQNGQLFEF
jgi:cAMP phosphodiesterase